MRQEPSCEEDAAEERQTENIFECQTRIATLGHRKRANQSLTNRIEGWRRFRREKVSFRCFFKSQSKHNAVNLRGEGYVDLK